MDIKGIIKKIQNLTNYRSMGVEKKETKDTYQVIHFKDSFKHKYNAVFFHSGIIGKVKNEVKQTIDNIHGNKDFLIGGNNVREKIAFQRQIQFKCTVLLEDLIYHLVSIFDNLPKIISVYYNTVKPEMNFRSAKNQLNHEHTKDLEITKLINNNWDWIEKIKDFRAQIFHHHSKICDTLSKTTFGKNKDGSQYFNEEIVINVPRELKEAIGYKEDKIEIEEFNDILINKSFGFFDQLFDLLMGEHEKYISKKKNKNTQSNNSSIF